MKIKSIAAVGAMGVGLGIAGLVGGTGTASAAECGDPAARIAGAHRLHYHGTISTFARRISPATTSAFSQRHRRTVRSWACRTGRDVREQRRDFAERTAAPAARPATAADEPPA